MERHVLILVVMEYGLRRSSISLGMLMVLILVVMEYGLRHWCTSSRKPVCGLNPCCNGIWSQTDGKPIKHDVWAVLILVVMEYGLRQDIANMLNGFLEGLNPCCNGIWSQTTSLNQRSLIGKS